MKEIFESIKAIFLKREDILADRNELSERDPPAILVCTWHPTLSKLLNIHRECFKLIDNDPKINKTFKEIPSVAFRRMKKTGNHLCRPDIRLKEQNQKKTKCKGCIISLQIGKGEVVRNNEAGTEVRLKPGASCRTEGTMPFVVKDAI